MEMPSGMLDAGERAQQSGSELPNACAEGIRIPS
jgi:hypothetical protein